MSQGSDPARIGSAFVSIEAICQRAATALRGNNQVVVARIAGLRDAMGPQWSKKRERVWAFIEREASKQLNSGEIFYRLNGAEFLLFCPERSESAKGIAFRVAEQARRFFLGDGVQVDGPEVLLLEASGGDLELRRADPEPTMTEFQARDWCLVPMRTVRGEELSVRCRCVDAVPLKQRAHPWLRVQVAIEDEIYGGVLDDPARQGLDPLDQLRIDTIVLAHAEKVLRSHSQRWEPSPLLISASLRTLTTSQARNRFQATLAQVPTELRRRIKLELLDIEDDTSTARVFEGVAASRSHISDVIPRVSGNPQQLRRLSERSWPALSVNGPDAFQLGCAPQRLRPLLDVSPTIIVHADEGADALFWKSAGATYLSQAERYVFV